LVVSRAAGKGRLVQLRSAGRRARVCAGRRSQGGVRDVDSAGWTEFGSQGTGTQGGASAQGGGQAGSTPQAGGGQQ
jgi:hypothetical protein